MIRTTAHHNYTLGEHLVNVLENTASQSNDPDLRLAALLHDVGKPASRWDDPETGISHYYRGREGQGDDHNAIGAKMAEERLRELRWPVARIKRISHIIDHHMFPAFSSSKGARKFLHRVGDEHADDLLTLRWADQHGKGQTPEELAARTSVDSQRGLVEQARSVQAPTSQSALAINGNDVIALGIKAGPAVGQILRRLTDDVVEDPSLNQPDLLKQRAQEYADAAAA
jgi:tRNA nucleotidyltransferase (CCA-adding enzyme)